MSKATTRAEYCEAGLSVLVRIRRLHSHWPKSTPDANRSKHGRWFSCSTFRAGFDRFAGSVGPDLGTKTAQAQCE